MLNVFLILAIIIVVMFIYIKARIFIDTKNYRKEHKQIFDAHRAIAYPSLTDIQQFNILDSGNTRIVSGLTKFDFVPTGLLNHYLNISPEAYFDYLKSKNLIEEMNFDSNNYGDGFYINQKNHRVEYLFIERQHIVFRKRFSSYDRLLKYIVYERLHVYAPQKYKYAWIKKYFV